MESPKQYPKVIAGAALIDNRGRIFLMRSSGKFGDYWIIPGGKVDFGECASDAVLREVREETGLVVEGAVFLGVRELIEPQRHFVCLEFLLSITECGPVTLNEEATEWGWFSGGDLDGIRVAPLTLALINERLIPAGHLR